MAHKNVLIVDDVAELGRMLQAALATLSDQLVVRVVPSAEEGLLEATRNPVDLMITDIRLPGISGLEFTRRVRLRHKAVKVIQISGMDDASLQQQSIEAGADLFFRKPLAMGEFLDAVDRLLDLKKTAPLTPPVVPAVDLAPAVLPTRLKEQINQLRQTLNSPAVGLIDDLGHIQVQEGDLEQILGGPAILPAVFNALTVSAKVPLTLGQADTETIIAFRGAMIDLMAASLNANLALVIAFKHGPTRVATAIAFDEMTRARLNILGFLREKGSLPVSRPAIEKAGESDGFQKDKIGQRQIPTADPVEPVNPKTEEKPVASEPDESLESLLRPVVVPDVAEDAKLVVDLSVQVEAQKNDGENADDFWQSAVEHQPPASSTTRPNTLSYEQARKMGLTPPDGEKTKERKP